MPPWFSSRLISFHSVSFRRLTRRGARRAAFEGLHYRRRLEGGGSGDGRNKKVENLESFLLHGAKICTNTCTKKRGENAEEKNIIEYKDDDEDESEDESEDEIEDKVDDDDDVDVDEDKDDDVVDKTKMMTTMAKMTIMAKMTMMAEMTMMVEMIMM